MNQITPKKKIWRRNELNIADELSSYIPGLLSDFLKVHPNYEKEFNAQIWNTDHPGWKVEGFKYIYQKKSIFMDLTTDPRIMSTFPTAVELTKRLGNDCIVSSYSSLEPNEKIGRHSDLENRLSEFIKIHIPLIVPKGNLFFEVEGEIIDWSDIFGFDNQLLHSAYNFSNERRLIYIIDVSRTYLGIEPTDPHDPEREKLIPPFIPNTSKTWWVP